MVVSLWNNNLIEYLCGLNMNRNINPRTLCVEECFEMTRHKIYETVNVTPYGICKKAECLVCNSIVEVWTDDLEYD